MDLKSGGFTRKNGAWNTWAMMDAGDLSTCATDSGGI